MFDAVDVIKTKLVEFSQLAIFLEKASIIKLLAFPRMFPNLCEPIREPMDLTIRFLDVALENRK